MNCREAPSVVTCSASNRARTPNALPVRRWQARQWQIETRTGSPSTVSRSCSQLQAACRVITSGIVDRLPQGTFPNTGSRGTAERPRSNLWSSGRSPSATVCEMCGRSREVVRPATEPRITTPRTRKATRASRTRKLVYRRGRPARRRDQVQSPCLYQNRRITMSTPTGEPRRA
jgi:hypothetical protein